MLGRRLLSYPELEEVLLDIETSMNNRPLLYQGEELEQPVPTPSTLLRRKAIPILEQDLEKIGEEGVTKWMRFLQKCKEQLQKRSMKEYVHTLDKQHLSTRNIDKTHRSGSVAERRYEGQPNLEANTFVPKVQPSRVSKQIAKDWIRDITQQDDI